MVCLTSFAMRAVRKPIYTLSHPENDRDVTGASNDIYAARRSFMRESRDYFLNVYENTHTMRLIISIFLWNMH